jgi:hypothetical protein
VAELSKILFLILISSVKFVAGPFFAYYDEKYDFTFFERFLYPVIGGMLGVVVFSYFSDTLKFAWDWIKFKFKKRKSRNEQVFSDPVSDTGENISVNYSYVTSEEDKTEKKLFTPRNRRIVTVWKKYGLIGIAFITPVIISIPLGTIIATRLVPNRKKVFLYLFVSIALWSLAMTSVFELYHVITVKDLQEKVIEP